MTRVLRVGSEPQSLLPQINFVADRGGLLVLDVRSPRRRGDFVLFSTVSDAAAAAEDVPHG